MNSTYLKLADDITVLLAMTTASFAAFNAVAAAITGLLGLLLALLASFGAAYATGFVMQQGGKIALNVFERLRVISAVVRVNRRAAHAEMAQNANDAHSNVFEFGAA